ncbi:MAG TPA: CoA pyrophosphatase [Caulobacteraceae bacterium]|jgi:8-oxo-dGTP pyrophosphatase MutT (NUDIX family)
MAKADRVEQPDAAEGAAPRAPLVRQPLALLGAAEVEALARAVLDPADGLGAEVPPSSDHDLNPEIALPLDGLQRAAVLVPLIERPEGLTVLFTQRADQLRRHAGQIAFPGGGCEAGENAVAAALREAHEEVDLDPALVRVAGLATPYRTLTGYHITPVVGFVRPSARFKANAGEVADVFEVPFAFLMDPANHERRHRDQPPGPPRWHWAITWPGPRRERLIWGATAGMVRGLYERLEAANGRSA